MTVRWAVIGSGGIARRRTIPEGITQAAEAELAAVFDINQQVNTEVADQFGAIACRSEEELLQLDNIDVVYVASPAAEHCRGVLGGASAGKHVLCEKPLGLTVEQAEQMAAACAEAGVLLGSGGIINCVPGFSRVGSLAATGLAFWICCQ